MSQKTNPISLRLQNNNKHFESCWYSDFFYSQVLSDEVNLRFYIEGLLLQAGRSKTLPSIQSQYKRYCTLLFFLDQRAERHKREFSLKISREPVERLILPRTKFLQSKKKSFNKGYPWKNLLYNHNRVQDILCKEKVLEKERYKDVIKKITHTASLTQQSCVQQSRALLEQHKSVFANNGKQEYVYKYAIKDFSFELLFLAGLDSTKFFNTKSSNAYNCIVNPGLKQNMFKQLPSKTLTPAKMEFKHAISNPKPFVLNTKVGNFASPLTSVLTNKGTKKAPLYLTNSKGCSFYTESKDFFGVSLVSFALCRLISYTQKAVFESPPLMPFSAHTHIASLTQRSCVREKLQQSSALLAQSGTKQAFNSEQALALLEVKYNSKLHTTKKGKDIAFLKSRLIKEPFSAHTASLTQQSCVQQSRALLEQRMDSIFSVQKGHENLFRSLIVDKYSQGTQNRLSFWFVKGVNETVANKAELCKQGVPLLTHTTSRTKQSKPIKECTTFGSVNMVDKTKLKKNGYLVPQKWRTKSLGLARHTELFLNIYSGSFLYHTIYPVRAISPFQSASFLLESIAYLLQRKSSFRQIKDDIFRELDQYQIIKGARLSCAGRLGGRSKKAQKAKIQTAQWGETSLTVFSSRLAFASKGVKTTYGKVGVKLWLCYK